MEAVANILVWIFLICLGLFLYGLAKPQAKAFQKGFGGNVTRKKLTKRFVPLLTVLFVMIGVFAPSDAPQTNLKTKNEQQSVATTKKDVAKVESAQIATQHLVTEVVDGDTIKVMIDGKQETVRFIGIDTPETVHPSKPVECFGREASDHMKTLVQGKKVTLEEDKTQSSRDKYKRLLRYVYLEDKTDVNRQMIADGFAFEYTYDSNPYKKQSEYKAVESSASSSNVGLWAPTACSGQRTAADQPRTVEQTPAPQPAPVRQSAPAPRHQEPAPQPSPSQPAASAPSNCDPNYSPCIPNVSYDLDCKDIGQRVSVIGNDHHRLDREGDGVGCESY